MNAGGIMLAVSAAWAAFTVWAYSVPVYGGWVAFGVACTALSFAGGVTAIGELRDERHRDEFGPLYRDTAGHQAWVETGLTDYKPGDTPVFEAMCLERLDIELEES